MISKTQGGIIRILWNEGKDVGIISKVSGVPREGVYNYVGNHRDACPPRKRSPKSIDWETVTCAWYEVEKRGTPVKDVAEMFGVTAATIYRWVGMYKKGMEENIDWETVTCAWYEVEKRGTPVKEVAEMFDVTTTTICRWVDLYRKGRPEDGAD